MSRFRQRLLHDGAMLEDDFKLKLPIDVQLVKLPFAKTSEEQVEE